MSILQRKDDHSKEDTRTPKSGPCMPQRPWTGINFKISLHHLVKSSLHMSTLQLCATDHVRNLDPGFQAWGRREMIDMQTNGKSWTLPLVYEVCCYRRGTMGRLSYVFCVGRPVGMLSQLVRPCWYHGPNSHDWAGAPPAGVMKTAVKPNLVSGVGCPQNKVPPHFWQWQVQTGSSERESFEA